jgi:hypothetical protein
MDQGERFMQGQLAASLKEFQSRLESGFRGVVVGDKFGAPGSEGPRVSTQR